MFGLTHLELVETLTGVNYAFALSFKIGKWHNENCHQSSPKDYFTMDYCTHLFCMTCLALRLKMFSTRANGVKELFGLNFDWYVAMMWGTFAWLNYKNPNLLMTDARDVGVYLPFINEGQINTNVCGTFAGAFSLAALGIIKVRAE